MEKFIIKKRNGAELELNSFRAGTFVTRAELTKSSSNENYIIVELHNGNYRDFSFGDSIFYDGMEYFINSIPNALQDNGKAIKTTLQFDSISYLASRVMCLNTIGELEFSYTGRVTDLLDLVCSNINRSGLFKVDSYYYDNEDGTFFDFEISKQNALNVLYSNLEELQLNYRFEYLSSMVYKLIVSADLGTQRDILLEYGATSEILSIDRSDSGPELSIINKLYVNGGSKNIPTTYRGGLPKLVLPSGKNYVEDTESIAEYGVFEGEKEYESIFPTFTGTVDDENDPTSFFVYNLPFNINNNLLPNLSPKISFKSGNLVGRDFEIVSYDHSNGLITLKTTTDDSGLILPSQDAIYKINKGDTFTILDIFLPNAYFDVAESKLLELAINDLKLMRNPSVSYSVEINQNMNFDKIDVWDSVNLHDNLLNLTFSIKVDSISVNILRNKLIGFTLSNVKQKGTNAKLLEDNLFVQKLIKDNKKYVNSKFNLISIK